jgi:UDP-N-acetylmuramyl tripeptide synthase
MIEVVNTPATIEATTQENQMNEATNTFTLTTPQPTDLLQSLMKLLDEHIEKKVAEALAKHVEAFRDIAHDVANTLVEDSMDSHCHTYDHDDYDRVGSNLSEIISDAIYDYDFDDKVADAISSYDLEDKIKDTIRDMTFSVSVE